MALLVNSCAWQEVKEADKDEVNKDDEQYHDQLEPRLVSLP
jgi:hypothetical protein